MPTALAFFAVSGSMREIALPPGSVFTLRPAVPDDGEWVDVLTRSTMRPYVEATWPEEPEREHYYYINRFRLEGTWIILCEGDRAGRVTLTWHDTWIDLEDVHLLPRFQGRGIGAALIGAVLEEAHAAGKAVTLLVLRVNPAQRLYERLGFGVVSSTPQRHFMRWNPERA